MQNPPESDKILNNHSDLGEIRNSKHDFIAVFDSGVGGISVLRHLLKQLPGERFVYFGDSANAPYGSRPTEEVRALTLAAVEKLLAEYPLKALVIACNTATAAAVKDVRAAHPELIVVGIEPALKVAADHYPGGRVGVLATEVTLREEKFDTLLHRFDEDVTIYKIPAPGLVELVEKGKVDTPETEALLRKVLCPYLGRLDAVVLGPTTPSRKTPSAGCWATALFCWTAARARPGRPGAGWNLPVCWKTEAVR